MNYTIKQLKEFEAEAVEKFEAGKIRGAIHLSDGNEEPLIEIFKNVDKEKDWVFSTWRNHYHALLKGIPRDVVMNNILDRKSISLKSKEHKFITSAIVTGIIPISVGAAYGIKRQGIPGSVWCFIGDMTSQTGSFYENRKYALNHDLPITFVIEDNGLSTNTPSLKSWGIDNQFYQHEDIPLNTPVEIEKNLLYYRYKRGKYPHVGCGKFVHF